MKLHFNRRKWWPIGSNKRYERVLASLRRSPSYCYNICIRRGYVIDKLASAIRGRKK